MGFFLEVLIGGLLAGVLYSLVALGFVLIFKASGVFNFAQGAMVLTAALALVRALDVMQGQWHWPFGLALAAAFAFAGIVMALVAWAVERVVLRKLVNQEGIILFMATIGITFFLEGLAQTVFGADVYPLNIGLPKEPIFLFESLFDGGILVNELDIWAAVIAGLLVAALALFFQRTRIGRALRAVGPPDPGGLLGRAAPSPRNFRGPTNLRRSPGGRRGRRRPEGAQIEAINNAPGAPVAARGRDPVHVAS